MKRPKGSEYLEIRFADQNHHNGDPWPQRLAELAHAFPEAIVTLSPDLLADLLMGPHTDAEAVVEQYLSQDALRQAIAITWRETNVGSDGKAIKALTTRLLSLVKYNLVFDCDTPEWQGFILDPERFVPPHIATEIIRATSVADLEARIKALYPAGYRPMLATNRKGEAHYTRDLSPLFLAVLKRAILLITNPELGMEVDHE